MSLAPNMFLRHRKSVVETGQMSSVEPVQMSTDVQMSCVETEQVQLPESSWRVLRSASKWLAQFCQGGRSSDKGGGLPPLKKSLLFRSQGEDDRRGRED